MASQIQIQIQIQDYVLKNSESGFETACVCIDLSAAFDTISHQVLLKKLKMYKVSNQVIQWFISYLSQWGQYTQIGISRSEIRPIKTGIFQGSLGGPILFIIFINDIQSLANNLFCFYTYADDTCILQKLSNSKLINQAILKDKLTEVKLYMHSNCLKLNMDKTEFMVLHPCLSVRKTKHHDMVAHFDQDRIEQQPKARLLGCQINPKFNQTEYINSVCEFLTKCICVMRMLSGRLSVTQRNMLAQGLVISKISFCLCYWATTSEKNLDRLQQTDRQSGRSL